MMRERTKAYYYFISGLTAFLVAALGVFATTIGDNISVSGTLSSTGATSLSSTLGVTGVTTLTGAAILSSTLDVAGNSTLASADIGGAYSAGGGSGSTITAAGKAQFNGDLEINGFATTTAASGNFANLGTVGVGTTTPSQELGVKGDGIFISTATTTITVSSTGSNSQGGCIQFKGVDGVYYRAYVVATTSAFGTGTNGSLRVESGSCQ